MTIATTVVLYFPDASAIQRLSLYAEYVDVLIIVDNTDGVDLSDQFKGMPRSCYVAHRSNMGVAFALNVAANAAIERGCSWMIMLDQDSVLNKQTHESLKECVSALDRRSVGLVSAVQVSKASDSARHQNLGDAVDVAHVMTSGSVLNLDAYRHCGPFEDKLFVDLIDTEYCLRLGSAGYRVLQLTRVYLDHSLGESIEGTIFGIKLRFNDHKPLRSYYYVRNGCYVAIKFFRYRPGMLASICFQIGKAVVRAVVFQDRKISRLKMMLLGFLHFCAGRYGPL